jgi:hypothetical protein
LPIGVRAPATMTGCGMKFSFGENRVIPNGCGCLPSSRRLARGV